MPTDSVDHGEEAADGPDGRGLRVLLVADNVADARLLRTVLLDLTGERADLTWVATWNECVESLAEAAYDLVVVHVSPRTAIGLTLEAPLPNATILAVTSLQEEHAEVRVLKRREAGDDAGRPSEDLETVIRSLRFDIERQRILRGAPGSIRIVPVPPHLRLSGRSVYAIEESS